MSLSGPTEFEAVAAESGLTGSSLGPEGDHTSADPQGAIKGRSLASIAWRRLRRDKVALVAAGVIVLLVLIAIFADVLSAIYGQSPYKLHNTGSGSVIDDVTGLPKGAFSGVSSTFWLGVTPLSGQDILTNLIFGTRTSLSVSLLATTLSLVLGISLGLIAGYFRGWADTLISRTMDVLLSFPTLLFSIALITVVSYINSDPSLRFWIIVFVLGFFAFPYIGRIVRGQVLSLREKEFVEAARSLGAGSARIMAREIAPNLVGPILVYTTLSIPNNMLGEAGLSFLGLGLIGVPSWGQMLADAGGYIQVDPFYLFLPGLAIFIAVLAFNLFGDGLRDALDPKSGR
ncbi:ABC transporter permease [uncultured Amnibacterium sp.]|uniref:ABC transporter permease n=1 Tax=uncultured Amnibacterium sp. TaxID=1631851 RepID=UPI0035CABAB9